jgi:histidinol-phosphatase (PHP family)
MNGRFCLSDDSHGVPQVGFGYEKVLDFMEQTGISTLHYLELSTTGTAEGQDSRFPHTHIQSIPVAELKKSPFWV